MPKNNKLIQVKMIDLGDRLVIEKDLNEWLDNNSDHINVVDIKYSTHEYSYTALIIYEELRK